MERYLFAGLHYNAEILKKLAKRSGYSNIYVFDNLQDLEKSITSVLTAEKPDYSIVRCIMDVNLGRPGTDWIEPGQEIFNIMCGLYGDNARKIFIGISKSSDCINSAFLAGIPAMSGDKFSPSRFLED